MNLDGPDLSSFTILPFKPNNNSPTTTAATSLLRPAALLGGGARAPDADGSRGREGQAGGRWWEQHRQQQRRQRHDGRRVQPAVGDGGAAGPAAVVGGGGGRRGPVRAGSRMRLRDVDGSWFRMMLVCIIINLTQPTLHHTTPHHMHDQGGAVPGAAGFGDAGGHGGLGALRRAAAGGRGVDGGPAGGRAAVHGCVHLFG